MPHSQGAWTSGASLQRVLCTLSRAGFLHASISRLAVPQDGASSTSWDATHLLRSTQQGHMTAVYSHIAVIHFPHVNEVRESVMAFFGQLACRPHHRLGCQGLPDLQ